MYIKMFPKGKGANGTQDPCEALTLKVRWTLVSIYEIEVTSFILHFFFLFGLGLGLGLGLGFGLGL